MTSINVTIPEDIKGYKPVAVMSIHGRITILGHSDDTQIEMPWAIFAYNISDDNEWTLVQGDKSKGEFFFTAEEGIHGDVIDTFYGWSPSYEIEQMTGYQR